MEGYVPGGQVSPWKYVQAWDVDVFGPEILAPEEQHRWSLALAIAGGLPYIWNELARPVCDILYGLLEAKAGDRVLIIGEGVAAAPWVADLDRIVGPAGEVTSFEVIRDGRNAVENHLRGRNGLAGCWQWRYTQDIPSATYDCVAVLQATQHCDDWPDMAGELVRVLRPGRRVLLAEAVLAGQHFLQRARADVHLQYWHEKAMARDEPIEIPYYSGNDLAEAFAGKVDDFQTFEWRGIEMAWGRKPRYI